jgi:hypothetical protein
VFLSLRAACPARAHEEGPEHFHLLPSDDMRFVVALLGAFSLLIGLGVYYFAQRMAIQRGSAKTFRD